MAKSLLLAYASPASEEAAAEFDTWYEGTHIPQIRTAVPSVGRVERYVLHDPGADPSAPARRLAVYELDTDDVDAAAAALGKAMADGALTMSAAMDTSVAPPVLQFFRHS